MTARGIIFAEGRQKACAVIVRRPAGRKLFLAESLDSSEGRIYSSTSGTWSQRRRPFNGEVLASRSVGSQEEALVYFRAWRRENP